MKNRNNIFTATLVALAFAFAPGAKATPRPDGGPIHLAANKDISARSEASSADSTSAQDQQMPVISIYSTGDVPRGKTGSFVLKMSPPVMFRGMYVKFTVSGTALQGIDYVPLVSPAYIADSGYGVILVQTLPDPRGFIGNKPYSVVVTLEGGSGYAAADAARSATMWIKP